MQDICQGGKGGGCYWNLTKFDVAVKFFLRRMTTWWRRQFFSNFYSSFTCYSFHKAIYWKETFCYCKIEFEIKKLKVRIWIQFAWMYWMGFTTWHHKKKMSQTCGRLVINNPYTNISIAEQESFKHFFCRLRLTVNKNIFFFKGVRGYVDINLIFWWKIYNTKLKYNILLKAL